MKRKIKTSKEAKNLAKELELSNIDAYIMELKTKLYVKSAKLIRTSTFTHESIAQLIGTSRSRISRIANYGENNISMELLIKIITALEGKEAIKIAA
ncbi:MAG: XRE family transcriptional regulator [Bdellovibrionaceae bacterium]|nr:XRE family transcriptional regulator [Pseudobdellovibrionaceae bacterium]